MTTAALVSAFTQDYRNLYNFKGLQSQQAARDLRQTLHVSLALERQLSGQLANNYASSLMNLQNPLPSFQQANNPAPAATTKQHPPLTASNSVAVCNAEANLKQREHRKLDRSVSEPVDNKQRQAPNSSRYKTELCRPFEESGTCKYGDKCQFAHGFAELRTLSRHPKYKTELCRTFHSTGFCPYGPRCHFIHNSEDSKKCLLDTLQTGNGNGSLSPTSLVADYDICGFSIGSAGELSPTGSISSGGGSPMSGGGFFYDGPKTAPPTMSNGGFFSSGDFKPLSIIPHDDYLSTSSEDEVMSSLGALVSEMDLDEPEPEAHVPAGQTDPVDINRNLIRLPIFSRLSLGSSP